MFVVHFILNSYQTSVTRSCSSSLAALLTKSENSCKCRISLWVTWYENFDTRKIWFWQEFEPRSWYFTGNFVEIEIRETEIYIYIYIFFSLLHSRRSMPRKTSVPREIKCIPSITCFFFFYFSSKKKKEREREQIISIRSMKQTETFFRRPDDTWENSNSGSIYNTATVLTW